MNKCVASLAKMAIVHYFPFQYLGGGNNIDPTVGSYTYCVKLTHFYLMSVTQI